MKYSQTPRFSAGYHNSEQGSVTTKHLLIGSGLFLALIIAAVGLIFALREFNSAKDDAAEETSSTTEEEADSDTPVTSEKMLEILAGMDVECEKSDLDSLVADIRGYLQKEDDYDATEHETNIDDLENELRADYQGPYFICSDVINNVKYELLTETDNLLILKLHDEYDRSTDSIFEKQRCEYADDPQKFYDTDVEGYHLAFGDWVISPYQKDYQFQTYHTVLGIDSLKEEFAKQNLTTKIPETIKVCG